MKTTTIQIDKTVDFFDLARAVATIGCELRHDEKGNPRIVKKRVRTPPKPKLVTVPPAKEGDTP